jgi:hypothetical protein
MKILFLRLFACLLVGLFVAAALYVGMMAAISQMIK